MKTSTRYGASVFAASLAAFASLACGASGPSIDDLNNMPSGGTDSTSQAGSSGSGTTTAGTGGAGTTGGVSGGGDTSTGGISTGGVGTAGTGTAGADPGGGTGTTGGVATGGTGGTVGTGGSGGGGGGGEVGPYAPRSGSFKMLVLTRTKGYRHASSIDTGTTMLKQIAQEQGFETTFAGYVKGANDSETDMLSGADLDAKFTAENLKQYEIIFHLNTTGTIFTAAQKKIYEDWMTANGAFAGVHSATDTENGWAFYSDVTGQYYNGHGVAGTGDQIKLEANMLDHPALKGIPNPWQRNEEWYKFDQWQAWSSKMGFKILGKKNADSQPIMWIREWNTFRAFYTALGHDGVAFQDATVKKHVTGGIMWAVRREHLIK